MTRLSPEFFFLFCFAVIPLAVESAEPLPIDPLWQSESFQKSVTGSYGIDTRIEPRLTTDEEFYLRAVAEAMAAGDRSKAIEELEGSSLLPESPAMLFQLGGLRFEEGNLDASAETFRSAIDLFPNFRDAHRNLAIALVRLEKYEEAQKHLLRCFELGARDGTSLGLLGYLRAREGHHRSALDSYRIAAISQPQETEWKLGQAQALSALNRTREALSLYDEVLQERFADFSIWTLQADAEAALGNDIEAIAGLEIPRRAKKLAAGSILTQGHLLLRQELEGIALERYLEAIAMEPPAQFGEAVQALDYLVRGGRIESSKTLAKAIRERGYEIANETTANAKTRSATGTLVRSEAAIEFQIGDRNKGADALQAWIEQEPTDGLALILLAEYHNEEGDREEAEFLLEQAARIPDSAAEALRRHGMLLVELRDYDAALERLEESHKLSPSDSLSRYIAAVKELAGN